MRKAGIHIRIHISGNTSYHRMCEAVKLFLYLANMKIHMKMYNFKWDLISFWVEILGGTHLTRCSVELALYFCLLACPKLPSVAFFSLFRIPGLNSSSNIYYLYDFEEVNSSISSFIHGNSKNYLKMVPVVKIKWRDVKCLENSAYHIKGNIYILVIVITIRRIWYY